LLVAVRADMVGLGRLQALLTDTTVEEVHILGCDRVRITRRNGVIDVGDPIADSDDEMVEVLQILARRAGATERSLSTSQADPRPAAAGGERLAATYQVSHRPYAVIRQHNTFGCDARRHRGRPRRTRRDDRPADARLPARRGRRRSEHHGRGPGRCREDHDAARARLRDPGEEPFILLEESRELGLHKNPHHQW